MFIHTFHKSQVPASKTYITPVPAKYYLLKEGAEISNIIKALNKVIFRHTEDFLKFNVKQEDIIISITSSVSFSRNPMTRGWEFVISGLQVFIHPPFTSVKNIILKLCMEWQEVGNL